MYCQLLRIGKQEKVINVALATCFELSSWGWFDLIWPRYEIAINRNEFFSRWKVGLKQTQPLFEQLGPFERNWCLPKGLIFWRWWNQPLNNVAKNSEKLVGCLQWIHWFYVVHEANESSGSHGLVVRAVVWGARGPSFNSITFQESFCSSGWGGREKLRTGQLKLVWCQGTQINFITVKLTWAALPLVITG